jgi:hypothetical protein
MACVQFTLADYKSWLSRKIPAGERNVVLSVTTQAERSCGYGIEIELNGHDVSIGKLLS